MISKSISPLSKPDDKVHTYKDRFINFPFFNGRAGNKFLILMIRSNSALRVSFDLNIRFCNSMRSDPLGQVTAMIFYTPTYLHPYSIKIPH